MTSSDELCLIWNDYNTNMSLSFKEIRDDHEFCDVTLAVEGNFKIEAHRVILAASSKFFKNLLQDNKHPHPLIYMRGIKEKHLSAIVDFMYHGQAKVHKEDINEFLIVAKELELKGLSGINSFYKKELDPSYEPSKKIQIQKPDNDILQDCIENQPTYIKVENYAITEENEDTYYNNEIISSLDKIPTLTRFEELDAQITPLMEQNDESNWVCKVCGKIYNSKNKRLNMMSHIEAKHIEGVLNPCNQCDKSFMSRKYLATHITKIHKQ